MEKHLDFYWIDRCIQDQESKTSICFLQIQEKASRIPHNIWSSVGNDLMDVKAGEIKGRLITQTYMLQCIRAKYDKNLSPKCIICKMDEEEDLRHFLLTCESLQNVREKHLRTIKTHLDNIKLGIYSKFIYFN